MEAEMSSGVEKEQVAGRVVPTSTPPSDTYAFEFPGDFAARIFSHSAKLAQAERLMLYTLIVALQPQRVLEIGFYEGGSATIMAAAMDAIDRGRLISIDPYPRVGEEWLAEHAHRVQVVTGASPDAINEARQISGGPFDFAFVDGDHTEEGLSRDLNGILPVLADSTYILFHDAYYYDVQRAIDAFVAAHSDTIQDCGVLVRCGGHDLTMPDPTAYWAGMRLLLFQRAGFSTESSSNK
jgi:predicted O-methyltransferase YrrM